VKGQFLWLYYGSFIGWTWLKPGSFSLPPTTPRPGLWLVPDRFMPSLWLGHKFNGFLMTSSRLFYGAVSPASFGGFSCWLGACLFNGLLMACSHSAGAATGHLFASTLPSSLLFGLHLPCICYVFTLHFALHFGKKPV
jgi:hypothetical protein